MWMNIGISVEFTAKELGFSVFDLYNWGRDPKRDKKLEPVRVQTTLAEYKVELARIK
jgi:hypothetical protein